jgi:hypothetical protein
VKLDCEYIDNRSLRLDFRIILQTIKEDTARRRLVIPGCLDSSVDQPRGWVIEH